MFLELVNFPFFSQISLRLIVATTLTEVISFMYKNLIKDKKSELNVPLSYLFHIRKNILITYYINLPKNMH